MKYIAHFSRVHYLYYEFLRIRGAKIHFPLGNLNQTFVIRLPRRDESLTSETLFLRLSIIMLPCRQRCSSYLSLSPCCLTHPLELDSFSSFSVRQLFFFLRSSAVRRGGRFRLRTVLFPVTDSSCPWFIGRTDGGTSLRMPEYSSWVYCIHLCCDTSLVVVMGCLFLF